MYGYTDAFPEDETTSDDFLDTNPLRAGLWMDGDSLAPPCGCEPPIIPYILDLLDLTVNDELWDLGCGDGRICIAAVIGGEEQGEGEVKLKWPPITKAVGVEIEEDVCDLFKSRIATLNLADEVKCLNADLRDVSIKTATCLVLYLLPEGIEAIQDKIFALMKENKEVRVVCNSWGFKGVEAKKKMAVGGVTLLLYDWSCLVV